MRVLVADPRAELRLALKVLLEQQLDMEVVGEIDQPNCLLMLIEETCPDIVLVDWEFMQGQVSDFLRELKSRYADMKIIVLSVRSHDRKKALDGGADAFACKCDPPEELLAELLAVKARWENDSQ